MVPENQDIWLQFRSDASLSYHARATLVAPNCWVPIFHHGAAYALSVSLKALAGRAAPDLCDGMSVKLTGGNHAVPLTSETSWAMFYWRLRYNCYVAPGADGSNTICVEERCQVLDWKSALEF
jgi:hypothetical protein